jgi:hypothetical protein
MSYFTLSTGEEVGAIVEAEIGGKKEPLPDGYEALCQVTGAEWIDEKTYQDGTFAPRYLKLLLMIIEPVKYKGRIEAHNIRVNDLSESKADKHRKVLATYDTVSGGKLRALGAKIDVSASIERAIVGTKIIARFGLMVSSYVNKDGVEVDSSRNYVQAVKRFEGISDKQIEAKAAEREIAPSVYDEPMADDYDDSVIF